MAKAFVSQIIWSKNNYHQTVDCIVFSSKLTVVWAIVEICIIFETNIKTRTKWLSRLLSILWQLPLFPLLFLAALSTKEPMCDWFKLHSPLFWSWWSGYCYWNERECGLNQSRVDSFVGRVAKNNSWNNGDRHKILEILLTNCFVLVITLLWQMVHNLLMTQILANLMANKLWLTVLWYLALVGLTKKRFGHYAILKILSLRSPW